MGGDKADEAHDCFHCVVEHRVAAGHPLDPLRGVCSPRRPRPVARRGRREGGAVGGPQRLAHLGLGGRRLPDSLVFDAPPPEPGPLRQGALHIRVLDDPWELRHQRVRTDVQHVERVASAWLLRFDVDGCRHLALLPCGDALRGRNLHRGQLEGHLRNARLGSQQAEATLAFSGHRLLSLQLCGDVQRNGAAQVAGQDVQSWNDIDGPANTFQVSGDPEDNFPREGYVQIRHWLPLRHCAAHLHEQDVFRRSNEAVGEVLERLEQ
mmetsp:Transcript_75710/g.201155  ORF Transcript_75710/g.201155 Transcript_75710/m.201155 type:complete len:265 (-) Transcript_75710:190-984(-)